MAQRTFESDGTTEELERTTYFTTLAMKTVHMEEEIDANVKESADDIDEQVKEYIEQGSGYYVKKIVSIEVKVFELQPFRSAKVNGYIKMPFKKSGAINYTNKDSKCFMYCVSAGLNWKELEGKVSKNHLYRYQT